jgi:hypothetical protein
MLIEREELFALMQALTHALVANHGALGNGYFAESAPFADRGRVKLENM